MKQLIFNFLKNLPGWKTKRKLLVISVDDYGNVRLDSRQARDGMDKAGLKVHSRFDAYDTLETREDLEALYEVLTSVKDKNGRHAVFTPFALPCNINFEEMEADGFSRYIYELLPETFTKLSSIYYDQYNGAWSLWKEGIREELMVPQFHGREHFNLRVFNEKIAKRDKELLTAQRNRSYTSISSSDHPNISYTAAYEFEALDENKEFAHILHDGLDKFKEVYGFSSTHFNPPGGREHSSIHVFLNQKGVKYLDTPFLKYQHEGGGKYKRIFNWTGKVNEHGQVFQVRNVVFEPTDNRGFDWVNYSFEQVKTAFMLNRPAIISSHRVNYCGGINPENRRKGLLSLKELLKKIVLSYPDVEFISSKELGEILSESI